MRRISPFAPAAALAFALPLAAQSLGGVRSVYPMITVSPYVPGPTAQLERELRDAAREAIHAARLNGGGPVATLKITVMAEDNPACPDHLALRTSFALQESATVARAEERRIPFVVTWQHDLMAIVPRAEAFEAAKDQAARLLKVLVSEIQEQNRPDVPND